MCNFEAHVAIVTDLVLESTPGRVGLGPGFYNLKPVDSTVTPDSACGLPVEGGQGPSRRPGCTSMRCAIVSPEEPRAASLSGITATADSDSESESEVRSGQVTRDGQT